MTNTNPTTKKSRRWPALALVGAGAFLFGGCSGLVIGSAGSESTPTPTATETVTVAPPQATPAPTSEPEEEKKATGYTVRLEAETATTEATVMYGPSGSSSTKNITPGEPWSLTIEDADRSEWYDVSVSDNSYMDETAEVTCRLYINDELVDQATGSGTGGYASCSNI